MLQWIITGLHSVPATFWGVLAGSVFTLLGVFATNRAHDRRLVRQLSHDREVKEAERQMSMRRDVFLAAVEALFGGVMAIMQAASQDNKIADAARPFTEKGAAIARAWVVGNLRTVKAFIDVNTQLADRMTRVMMLRMHAESLQASYEACLRRIEEHEAEIQRLASAMIAATVVGSRSEEWQEANVRSLTEGDALRRQYAAQARIAGETTEAWLRTAEAAGEAVFTLAPLLAEVASSVRVELGLETDERAIALVIEEGQRAAREAVERILAHVRAQVGEPAPVTRAAAAAAS